MTIFDLSYLRPHQSQLPLLAFGLAYIGLSLALRNKSPPPTRYEKVIPSPRDTLLPKLSEAETADLPYPPDVLPGARDVESPYGTLRVYEWGPEEGRKVLLIHGISTPCVSLGGLAHGLADKGCRVMLFDLWGRGYTDHPTLLPHDTRLFTTAILLALTSSSLSWTGSSNAFSLIGYSLGGGISASFTSYFPSLISSLILLAPSGLIRDIHFSTASKIMYSTGIVPESALEWMVKRRLRGGPTGATAVKPKEQAEKKDEAKSAEAPVTEELPKGDGFDGAVLSKRRPGITVASAVAWQVEYHEGFIKSFMSSIRFGPISNQHEEWRRIGQRLCAQNATTMDSVEEEGMQNGKVLIICGKDDPIIIKEELLDDATEVLGENNIRFETCDAGHELPITRSEELVGYIWDFWDGR